jgi:hypothetical protein
VQTALTNLERQKHSLIPVIAMQIAHPPMREVFEPEQITICDQAYHRALDFVRQSGDADGDENVCKRIAEHILVVGRRDPSLNLMRVTNTAIARYRVQRAQELVRAAQTARLQSKKPKKPK